MLIFNDSQYRITQALAPATGYVACFLDESSPTSSPSDGSSDSDGIVSDYDPLASNHRVGGGHQVAPDDEEEPGRL